MYYFKIIFKLLLVLISVTSQYNILHSSTVSNFYLTTEDDVTINQDKKTIHTSNNFVLTDKLTKYSGKQITIWYKTLNNLNLDKLYRIEAQTNIKIENTYYDYTITADKYIYSAKAFVHTLISEKNDLVYKDMLRTVTAKDRIEYFTNKNIVVIRGNPKIVGRNSINSTTFYNFSANLINIQLTSAENTHKDIVFIEAINKVAFKERDNVITSDYAIYYKEQNQIEFYDNVTFTNSSSSLKGSLAIYNLKLGYGKIFSINTSSPIKGKYDPNK